jgi:putative two-component system response regulator
MMRRNILAADNSTLVLDGLDSLFSPFHRVIHAPNGAIALQLARELRPHLIISDVVLRNLDGIEFLREVRRDPEIGHTPMILWSVGYQPPQIKALANGWEPIVALNKLDDLDVLVSTVNGLLDTRS